MVLSYLYYISIGPKGMEGSRIHSQMAKGLYHTIVHQHLQKVAHQHTEARDPARQAVENSHPPSGGKRFSCKKGTGHNPFFVAIL